MKYCNSCGCELIVPDTWLESSKKSNQYKCRSCKSEYLKQWRENNPGAYKEWKYDISQKEYEALLDEQEDHCAICGTDAPGGRHNNWHIDHDHETGEVRGLLCHNCNRGLGFFKDDPLVLAAAKEYLEDYK